MADSCSAERNGDLPDRARRFKVGQKVGAVSVAKTQDERILGFRL